MCGLVWAFPERQRFAIGQESAQNASKWSLFDKVPKEPLVLWSLKDHPRTGCFPDGGSDENLLGVSLPTSGEARGADAFERVRVDASFEIVPLYLKDLWSR